ncbi:MAG: hypothetical protein HY364_03860 [Candidatus Aenigmarchaeota archaeon]|nr:hypothetical protein [Candidatus Aenigmarchaeota archaeon]
MPNLFIARHGNYHQEDGSLNTYGAEQIDYLGCRIKESGQAGCFYILTAGSPMSQNSAERLADLLGDAYVETDPMLREYTSGRIPLNAIIGRVDEAVHMADNVVVVTHKAVSSALPPFYVRSKYGLVIPHPELRRGHAIFVRPDGTTEFMGRA